MTIAFQFDGIVAGPFRNRLARVALGNQWGYIDTSGNVVIPPQFEMAYDFSEGLARVKRDGRSGYCDELGRLVIPNRFSYSTEFSEGLAAADDESGKTGFIDSSGQFAIPPRFTGAGRFRGGVCLVTTDEDVGYIDTKGEFIWRGPFVETPLGFDLRF